jgi:hypothetical protein
VELILIFVVAGLVMLWRRRRGHVMRSSEVGAVGWVPGTNWRVLRPLARAEMRQLVRHPAFLIGIAMTPLMGLASTSEEAVWAGLSPAISLSLVPLAWTVIVAANLLVLRPRRTAVDELFSSAPAPQPVRTAGSLFMAAPAAAVAAVLTLAIVVLALFNDPLGSVNVGDVAVGPLLVAGGAVVGVAVARFLPRPVFGFAAAFAVSFIQARFFELDAWPWYRTEADPFRFLAFHVEPTSLRVDALEVRPSAWHLVYLVALIAMMACVALARSGVPRRLSAALAIAVFVVVGTGWIQTRPPSSARVAEMVSYVTSPREHQSCTVAGPTTLCAYPENRDRRDDWVERVGAVRALLPGSLSERRLDVIDRLPTIVGNSGCGPAPALESLPPKVVAAVSADDAWPADGAVHPGTANFPCGGHSTNELFTAVQVGSWAVGLPPSPHGPDVRCSAQGQARAVVALWLGGAATPSATKSYKEIVTEFQAGPITFAGWSEPPMFGATFDADDMRLARALLALPVEHVQAGVSSAWDRLVDPATPSSAVADLFGISERGARLGRDSTACR